MYIKNEGEIKTFSRCTKAERIYHQPAYITRNVTKRKIISSGNLDLYKEMKSTRNGIYVGKCKLLLLLFKSI